MPRGIYQRKPFSEEHKRKLSEINKGKKHSEETRKKLSESHKGKKHSEETKKKISIVHKGKKWTKKRRKKISGNKCRFWKGGITPENKRIRQSIEFRLWREAVFTRDNWTCQKTGIKSGKLRPHHIKNFAQYPESRFAIDNGITFSEKSHKEFHKIYGIKNNTKEQLKAFVEIQGVEISYSSAIKFIKDKQMKFNF